MDPNTVETWQFINSFAPWLAGIGTLAVVLTTLHFAFERTRVRLRVSAAQRIIVWPTSPNDEIVEIKVVNLGFCDTQVTEIVWKVGIFRRRHLLQVFNFSPKYRHLDEHSDSLPKRLSHGEQARYIIPFDPWIGHLALAAIHFLKEVGDPLPGAIAVIGAWVDLPATGDSIITMKDWLLKNCILFRQRRT